MFMLYMHKYNILVWSKHCGKLCDMHLVSKKTLINLLCSCEKFCACEHDYELPHKICDHASCTLLLLTTSTLRSIALVVMEIWLDGDIREGKG